MSMLGSISSMDDLKRYFEAKIEALQKVVDLTCSLNSEEMKDRHRKIYNELGELEEILDKLEVERDRRRALLRRSEGLMETVQRINDALGRSAPKVEENHLVIPPKRVPITSVLLNPHSEDRRSRKISINEYLEEYEAGSSRSRNSRLPVQREDVRIHPLLLLVTEMSHITEADFVKVPKYLRGRLTPDKVNSVVDVLNQACAAKYDVLKTPKSKQSDKIRNAIREYRDQETKETQGYNFIVEKDILAHTDVKIDKTFLNIVTILRVVGRLKEVRGNNLVRYVFLGNR